MRWVSINHFQVISIREIVISKAFRSLLIPRLYETRFHQGSRLMEVHNEEANRRPASFPK